MKAIFKLGVAVALCLPPVANVLAQAPEPAKTEIQRALEAARETAQTGPVDVPLRGQAVLNLPEHQVFIPQKEAAALMIAMGNHAGEDLIGVIFPIADEPWFAVLRYEKSGYIRDGDAKEWDADELLASLKAGTEEGNKQRAARGIPAMEVIGWAQPPEYDAATQRLRWSIATRDKGAPADAEQGVNYNTYALGREGYISLNLVTDLAALPKEKPVAEELLAALNFDEGKRYADFNSSTDHVAEYGLAALVAGVAAKKLGMFALIAAFAVKFAKVIGIAVIAFGTGLAKYFKGKKDKA